MPFTALACTKEPVEMFVRRESSPTSVRSKVPFTSREISYAQTVIWSDCLNLVGLSLGVWWRYDKDDAGYPHVNEFCILEFYFHTVSIQSGNWETHRKHLYFIDREGP